MKNKNTLHTIERFSHIFIALFMLAIIYYAQYRLRFSGELSAEAIRKSNIVYTIMIEVVKYILVFSLFREIYILQKRKADKTKVHGVNTHNKGAMTFLEIMHFIRVIYLEIDIYERESALEERYEDAQKARDLKILFPRYILEKIDFSKDFLHRDEITRRALEQENYEYVKKEITELIQEYNTLAKIKKLPQS